MNRKTPHVIDLELEEPSRMSPALSQIDRLLKQSLLETQSLHVVRHLLMREQMDKAQSNGAGKLLAAVSMRQQDQLPVLDAAPKKKRRKHAERQSPQERTAAVVAYLQQHPGADTDEIAAGLGWRSGLVVRFVGTVATGTKNGHRKPQRWFLKEKKTPATKTMAKAMPGERSQQIRAFLSRHPEALTKDIAKAINRKANSTLVKMIRTVAKPVRPTKATQPIQWVLSAAS